jgi:hypothetical protein
MQRLPCFVQKQIGHYSFTENYSGPKSTKSVPPCGGYLVNKLFWMGRFFSSKRFILYLLPLSATFSAAHRSASFSLPLIFASYSRPLITSPHSPFRSVQAKMTDARLEFLDTNVGTPPVDPVDKLRAVLIQNDGHPTPTPPGPRPIGRSLYFARVFLHAVANMQNALYKVKEMYLSVALFFTRGDTSRDFVVCACVGPDVLVRTCVTHTLANARTEAIEERT